MAKIGDATLRSEWASRSAASPLRSILQKIRPWLDVECDFSDFNSGRLSTSEGLTFIRIMFTIAAIRAVIGDHSLTRVTESDYSTARNLLVSLPIPSRSSELPTHAALAGEFLAQKFGLDSDHTRSIPGRSDFGSKLFTRRHASKALELSYNTAKKYLVDLVKAGVVDEFQTSPGSRPERHYSFVSRPPFLMKNPFESLPPVSEVARGCNQLLQT